MLVVSPTTPPMLAAQGVTEVDELGVSRRLTGRCDMEGVISMDRIVNKQMCLHLYRWLIACESHAHFTEHIPNLRSQRGVFLSNPAQEHGRLELSSPVGCSQ